MDKLVQTLARKTSKLHFVPMQSWPSLQLALTKAKLAKNGHGVGINGYREFASMLWVAR